MDAITSTAIEAAVENVRAQALDGESAHAAEDELYEAVLRAIADGTAEDPAAMAAAALATKDIGFSRWCG